MSDAATEPDFECRQCRHWFNRRSSVARFCPHCGFAFIEPVALQVQPPPPENLEALRRETAGQLDEKRSKPLERVHSLMLLGYANAMLHLGWRYEKGSGAVRNLHEAERCYLKSAKLGNVFARARLSEQQLAEVVRREATLAGETKALPVESIERKGERSPI